MTGEYMPYLWAYRKSFRSRGGYPNWTGSVRPVTFGHLLYATNDKVTFREWQERKDWAVDYHHHKWMTRMEYDDG